MKKFAVMPIAALALSAAPAEAASKPCAVPKFKNVPYKTVAATIKHDGCIPQAVRMPSRLAKGRVFKVVVLASLHQSVVAQPGQHYAKGTLFNLWVSG